MPCYRCGRVQTDPAKGASPWAVGVKSGEQVLVCPPCQSDDPEWSQELERCPHCHGTRLKVVMGTVVCRQCGHDWPADR
jgi:Zn finger protein HypA/HybF involved in hydrogenase expression